MGIERGGIDLGLNLLGLESIGYKINGLDLIRVGNDSGRIRFRLKSNRWGLIRVRNFSGENLLS